MIYAFNKLNHTQSKLSSPFTLYLQQLAELMTPFAFCRRQDVIQSPLEKSSHNTRKGTKGKVIPFISWCLSGVILPSPVRHCGVSHYLESALELRTQLELSCWPSKGSFHGSPYNILRITLIS